MQPWPSNNAASPNAKPRKLRVDYLSYNELMRILKQTAQFVVSIAVAFAAGGLGSLATIPNIPTWYAQLEKPPLLPPNEIFGPVWSVLYLLMGIALFLIWTSPNKKKLAYAAFFAQLVLNTLWSFVFFGLHQPWLGLIVILLLIGAIIWTMYEFKRISKTATWLFIPYLLWVLFATYLTVGVAILN